MAWLKDLTGSAKDAIVRQIRNDGWVNASVGLGGLNDKRSGTQICPDPILSPQQCMVLFTHEDLARLICTARPDAAFKPGFELCVDDDDARESALAMRTKELDLARTMHKACVWGQTCGGGGLMLGLDDGLEPDMPLRTDENGDPIGIKKLRWVHAVDRRRMRIVAYNQDPLSPNFGKPELYGVQPIAGVGRPSGALSYGAEIRVHTSRMIMFGGVLTGDEEKAANEGWDHSVLQPVWSVLKEFGLSWSAATYLIHDASQAVYGVKGLSDMLRSEDGEEQLTLRFRVIQLARSVARSILIDADGESFEKKPTSFTGLPDMMDRVVNRLAAAARIPVTVLMGQAPAGLNATGAADLETWYQECESWRTANLDPALRQVIRILLSEGGQTEPKTWRVEWKSIDPNREAKEIVKRKGQAEIDHIYITDGVYTTEEVGLSRFGAEGWSMETTIDLDLRKKLDEIQDEKSLLEAENGLETAANPPPALPAETPADPGAVPPVGKPGAQKAAPVAE